jgi:hypothetical protein
VRSRRRPDRQLTTLQETAVIVTAILTAVVLTAVPFGIIRAIWPGVTPDLRSLLFRPRPCLGQLAFAEFLRYVDHAAAAGIHVGHAGRAAL